MNDGLVMSESASTLFIALLLWRLLRVRPTASWRAVVAIGAVAGLAALARSELIVLVGLSAVWLWATDRATSDDPTAEGRTVSRSLRRPALFVVGAGVVVLPWVAFNLSRFERPVYLTTNDGTTLMGTYCADAFYGPGTGTWSLNCITADPEYRADEEPSVRSARQRTLALTYASDHLRRLPGVVAARVGGTLDLYGLSVIFEGCNLFNSRNLFRRIGNLRVHNVRSRLINDGRVNIGWNVIALRQLHA